MAQVVVAFKTRDLFEFIRQIREFQIRTHFPKPIGPGRRKILKAPFAFTQFVFHFFAFDRIANGMAQQIAFKGTFDQKVLTTVAQSLLGRGGIGRSR